MRIFQAVFLLIVFISLFNQNILAQFHPTIRTARPGKAVGANTVGKKIIQLQSGFYYGENKFLTGNKTYNNLNSTLRYGITERLEINTNWVYQTENYLSIRQNGFKIGSIGGRIKLIETNKFKPAVSLQLNLNLPFQSVDFKSNDFGGRALLSASKKITSKTSILANIAYYIPNNGKLDYWNYAIHFRYNISPKWSTFIENYSNFTINLFENYWDSGLSYLVNNNVQFDVFGGTSLNKSTPDFFVSIGFSGRIVSLRK